MNGIQRTRSTNEEFGETDENEVEDGADEEREEEVRTERREIGSGEEEGESDGEE